MTTLQLNRRGKLIRAALIVVAIWLTIAVIVPALFPQTTTRIVSVTVYAGETLWGIAEREAPNADPRDFIQQVVEINGLTSSTIEPGQQILVPITTSK